MSEIRKLIWDGALNVQICVDDTLVLKGTSTTERLLNVRIPRDTYIVVYLEGMLKKLQRFLRFDVSEVMSKVWFECDGQLLPWYYPMGVLFDTIKGSNSKKGELASEYSINVWKIDLKYALSLPRGHIPIVDEVDQIRSYWMHQWKQACFILNGSSKAMMSLSIKEAKKFWKSVINREQDEFDKVSAKILSRRPQFIPLILHRTNSDLEKIQPTVSLVNSNGSIKKLLNVLLEVFPDDFTNGMFSGCVVSQGIVVSLEDDMFNLYTKLRSFDGFLHLIVKEIGT
ncbi:hypothetical protein KAFR_0H02490 [Kazachstania africana CBS 2517]|uniref:Autophagy protein 5 n=1 Tax=Kazachstania africana (strain ATCC 22294 / BCRC 22015 / CBS 2517 / CECT 1963 / NBRC 1671 / NRRL Y-8276) TaxID=1071382 RepID=H2AZA2_KAZAF|nr:hypothetical protein KAFR_0H02490 [Kazachstania africana CBS 2517]CCF59658.1 hypothetical protein KAFR_0H02490 [Kazachstania africana CBS 2517]